MKPLRVSIIESVHTQHSTEADSLQQTLSNAGMIVSKLCYENDPYAALNQFDPELILTIPSTANDVMMHFIHELRKNANYVNVPIIFFASKPELINQLSLSTLEGDGFIISPMQPNRLISIITQRIMRARQVGSQMIHDSLTGLLNHVRLLEQLEIEIARAKRDNACLSFVMIDIDHFKRINDVYGHLIGDSVIKKLAHLLKKRLRKSDSVGRYGGDEFAIILPESKALTVEPILTEIKNQFAHYTFSTDTDFFQVTLSAGIAQLSDQFSTVTQLIQAADDALYYAKNQGRNHIITTT